MNLESKLTSQIQHNKSAHDLIASSYDQTHVEIYNPTEQARIEQMLKLAISQLSTSSNSPFSALDFGAGTGNLTGHLLKLRMRVVAADVSAKSLSILKEKYPGINKLETEVLNGIDLLNIKNDSFDMVATYSVLHHVPDYLAIIKEFVRVVKPGGIIYIDHENAPSVWLDDSDEYNAYKKELEAVNNQSFVAKLFRKIKLLFSYRAWRRLVKRKLHGLNDEGDIHVFKDDHIEWSKVEEVLLEKCVLINREDYLVCREMNSAGSLYEKYNAKCVDMRMVISRKSN
jgi:ubiquinone/menaquinone biosynthesis C-methylase UbiE